MKSAVNDLNVLSHAGIVLHPALSMRSCFSGSSLSSLAPILGVSPNPAQRLLARKALPSRPFLCPARSGLAFTPVLHHRLREASYWLVNKTVHVRLSKQSVVWSR